MTKKKEVKDLLPKGRPTMYQPEFCEQLIEYFSVEPNSEVTRMNEKTGNEYSVLVPNALPSLAGFATKLKVSRDTLRNWAKARPDFAYAVERAKAAAEHMLVVNGLAGLYDPRFAMFVAKNYTEMRDLQEHSDVTPSTTPNTPEEIEERIAALDKHIEALQAQL